MEVVDEYLAELARRMRDVLGGELVAVYAGGSSRSAPMSTGAATST